MAVAWQEPGLNQQLIEGVYLSPSLYPDFRDFAFFAKQWRRTDCGIVNSWCNGADFDHSGSILLDDLQAFANDPLVGAE